MTFMWVEYWWKEDVHVGGVLMEELYAYGWSTDGRMTCIMVEY
jgi:hypothetical protein